MLVTAQKLIDGGLERADMVGSNFITDQGKLDWVNESYSELYDVILRCNEDDYVNPTPTEFTVASGDYSYDLPTDFFKMIGLDREYGGKWIEIRKFNFNKRNRLKSSWLYTARTLIPAVRYRLLGSKILFDSQDDASGKYRIWYIPVPTVATLTTDNFTIETTTHRKYIETAFAIKCLDKEESDTSKLEMKLAKYESDIMATKKNRDDGEPERIANYDYFENYHGDEGWT